MPASATTGALVDANLADLSQAARKAFTALAQGINPADVLGFGLFSDVDGADVTAAIQTRSGLAESLEHYASPAFEAVDDDFDWQLYLTWYPGEWACTSDDLPPAASADLKRVWGTIRDLKNAVDAEEAQYWPSIQYEAAFIAIGLAWEEGFFADYPNATRVFAVMDGDQDAETVLRWLSDLNYERADEARAYVVQEFS